MRENQLTTYLALDQAYQSGNTLITDRVEAIVAPQEAKLPDSLQEILDSIKDSPIHEPELYAILEKDNGMLIGFTEAVSKTVNLDDFDAITASEFVSRARFKILNKTDKDGVFKSTPNLDALKLPKMSTVRMLADALVSGGKSDKFGELALSLADLPAGVSLSKWEKSLVEEMFTMYAMSAIGSLGGAAQDRTPFARYLKNV